MLDVVWDHLTDAALLGWLTTALFGALAGAAVAVWARVHVAVGLLAGLLTVFLGLAVLVVVGLVRAGGRRREQGSALVASARARRDLAAPAPRGVGRASAAALEGATAAPPVSSSTAPVWATPAPATTDVWSTGAPASGAGSFGGWGQPAGGGAVPAAGQVGPGSAGLPGWGAPAPSGGELVAAAGTWPVPAPERGLATTQARSRLAPVAGRLRRPATPVLVVAVVALLVAVAFAVTSQLTWVSVRGLDGSQIWSAGPFELQLGVFVVASAVAAATSAVGVLFWHSVWWPVLCAWFGAWWVFVSVEAMSLSDSVAGLNRVVQSTVTARTGYDEKAALLLGDGWTWVLATAVGMLALSAALVVLQHRSAARRPA